MQPTKLIALMAAIEFACLDIIVQKLGQHLYNLLGGKLREQVPFASYLFFRYASEDGLYPEVRTIDQLLAHTADLKDKYGFQTHKLNAGVFTPEYELDAYLALCEAFSGDSFRIDPNACWSVGKHCFAKAIEHLPNDYLEDRPGGLNGLRRVREKTSIP